MWEQTILDDLGDELLEVGSSAVSPSVEEHGLELAKYPLATLSIFAIKTEISLVKLGFCRGSCLHDFPTLIIRKSTVNDQAVATSLRR